MILSVIIVNYNVKYFLEQCLYSVEKALLQGVAKGAGGEPAAEIFVVDNHSSDGSVKYLQSRFPRVRFIVNRENMGFGKANNQALGEAKGEFILFLNPDTILPEDSCRVCLSFMREVPGVGALGMRMVDGSGRFLKESRRGFPSPWVAFCKLAGLTALFPHSRFLAGYYLGHLPSDRHHPAPILSGACMWVSREVLDRAGSFDEQFFMYAEDIDLSYRIEKAGYTNYYIAEPTILHFKGESTRKDARYIKLFYKAMSQFRRKHFSGGVSALFNGGIEAAIWFRAAITAIAGWFRFGKSRGTAGGLNGRAGIGRAGRPERYKTWITGDAAGVAQLAVRLSSSGERELVPGWQDADEIIFCEGPSFSFSDCITALQKAPQGVSCKIHAAGSGSAAGSHSKEERGQTIVL